MTHNNYVLSFLILGLAGLAGCSSQPPKKETAAPDKIHGKAQIVSTETTGLDASMNAGGPSVYLVDGLSRYRLFFNKPFEVEPGKEYVAEGVYAQKAIDAMGDPDQGKNGYPLDSSCGTVVRTAWPGLALDLADSYANSLRDRVKRFPARPVFLVTKLEPVSGATEAAKQGNDVATADRGPEVSIPADKQRALLIEAPPSWVRRFGNPRAERLAAESSSTRKARLRSSTVARNCARLCRGLSSVTSPRSKPGTLSESIPRWKCASTRESSGLHARWDWRVLMIGPDRSRTVARLDRKRRRPAVFSCGTPGGAWSSAEPAVKPAPSRQLQPLVRVAVLKYLV